MFCLEQLKCEGALLFYADHIKSEGAQLNRSAPNIFSPFSKCNILNSQPRLAYLNVPAAQLRLQKHKRQCLIGKGICHTRKIGGISIGHSVQKSREWKWFEAHSSSATSCCKLQLLVSTCVKRKKYAASSVSRIYVKRIYRLEQAAGSEFIHTRQSIRFSKNKIITSPPRPVKA